MGAAVVVLGPGMPAAVVVVVGAWTLGIPCVCECVRVSVALEQKLWTARQGKRSHI